MYRCPIDLDEGVRLETVGECIEAIEEYVLQYAVFYVSR